MNFRLPNVPAWAVVTLVVLAGVASIAAEFLWPRHTYGPPLEARAGFYAGAGFAAALFVLLAGWIARLLQDNSSPSP